MPLAAGVVALRVAGGEELDRNTYIPAASSDEARFKTVWLSPLLWQVPYQSGRFMYLIEIQGA